MSRADITRCFQNVPARTRMEILCSLIERNEIIEDKVIVGKGRPMIRYKAV
jgi:hypothetical protein